jgi:hypothetical protein
MRVAFGTSLLVRISEQSLNLVSGAEIVMADPNIKTVTIVNNKPMAPEEAEPMEGGEKPKKRQTKKKKFVIHSVTVKKEGGGQHPGTIDQLVSTRVPGSDDTKAIGSASEFTQSGATVGPIAPSLGGAPQAPPRVVLAKSRKKSSVILGPKHAVKPTSQKKTAKKLNMNLKGLTRMVDRAKKIESRATETTVADIKTELVKAGLVKAETKAPESVLRQIYSDLMVLKKRAL